jgi:hypothetical protein
MRVIPHFEQFPLLSSKGRDFERFAKVCELVAQGVHLTRPGLREIVELAVAMNVSGKRRFTAERMVEGMSEVIVSAISNDGAT